MALLGFLLTKGPPRKEFLPIPGPWQVLTRYSKVPY